MPKWEARAKYSGCKAHFSGEECQHLLNWLALYRSGTNPSVCRADAAELCNKMGKAIRDLQVEYPDLLKDRTEEEVEAALKKDQEKIKKQLTVIKQGGNWKKVE